MTHSYMYIAMYICNFSRRSILFETNFQIFIMLKAKKLYNVSRRLEDTCNSDPEQSIHDYYTTYIGSRWFGKTFSRLG